MSKAKKNHRNNQILAQNKAHRRSSRKEKQQEWRIPHGSMLLNAANVYSIHGKVPKLTNLFSCKEIHKLFEDSGYEHKDYRNSLWQTMGFFVLSFVFAALAGNASLAHVQLEYNHLCALANVKPASPRTVEKSMEQSKAISAAMKALASKFITSYHQLVDNLDYITVGADIVQKLKKLGDIDNIRLSDGSEYRLAREDNKGDCKGKTVASRKLHAAMDLVRNCLAKLNLGSATSDERYAFIENTNSQHEGCTLDLLDAGYNSEELKNTINSRGDKFIIKGRNQLNPSVRCVTKYEVNYDSNGNYNIGSIVSKKEFNSATKLSDLIKNGTVVAYEISQGKIIGYCYDLVLSDGFRLLLIYNPKNKSFNPNKQRSYWVFLNTNLSLDFNIEVVASLYRLRWQIEIMFLAHKSLGSIESSPDHNSHTGDICVYAAIIAHVLKMYIAYQSTNDYLLNKEQQQFCRDSDAKPDPVGKPSGVLMVSMQKAASHLGSYVSSWLLYAINSKDMVTEKVIYQESADVCAIIAYTVRYSRVSAKTMSSGKSIFSTIATIERCVRATDTG